MLRNILKKNPYTIWRIGLEDPADPDAPPVYTGFFEVFPLTKRVVKDVIAEKRDGRTFRETDLCSPKYDCRNFYIASIGVMPDVDAARQKHLRAGIIRELLSFIATANQHHPINLFARPVTKDGFRLLRRYGFRKIHENKTDLDSMWTKRLRKGEALSDGSATRRSLQAS